MQTLIKNKKRKLLQKKLFENIRKPEEVWKIIKKLDQRKRLQQQTYATISKYKI